MNVVTSDCCCKINDIPLVFSSLHEHRRDNNHHCIVKDFVFARYFITRQYAFTSQLVNYCYRINETNV